MTIEAILTKCEQLQSELIDLGLPYSKYLHMFLKLAEIKGLLRDYQVKVMFNIPERVDEAKQN